MSDGLWVVSCTFDGFGEDGDSTDGGLQLVRDICDEVSAGLGQPDMSRAVTGRDNGVAVIIERTDSHGENEVGPRGGPFHLHGVDDVAPLAPGSTHQFEQSLVSDT